MKKLYLSMNLILTAATAKRFLRSAEFLSTWLSHISANFTSGRTTTRYQCFPGQSYIGMKICRCQKCHHGLKPLERNNIYVFSREATAKHTLVQSNVRGRNLCSRHLLIVSAVHSFVGTWLVLMVALS